MRLVTAAILASAFASASCTTSPPAIYSSESDVPARPVVQAQVDTVAGDSQPGANSLQAELGKIKSRVEDRGLVLTLDDLLFKTNSAELKHDEAGKLSRLVRFLKKHADFDVIIEGHTDTSGSTDRNRVLSKARAILVYEELVAAGIAKQRLAVIALGDKYPIASNDTPEGRQQNRRVEIVISGGKKAQ